MLKVVKLIEGIELLPKGLFDSIEHLEEIMLPSTIKEIQNEVIVKSNKLERLIIPDSIEVMHRNSIKSCDKLKSIKCKRQLLKYIPKNQKNQLILMNDNWKKYKERETSRNAKKECNLNCNNRKKHVIQ